MIEIAQGNLIETATEALVNTVNCLGYMGKGIALQFKKAFPDNFKAYERSCRRGKVEPGKMFVFETGSMINPKYIINFPTKRHWRGASKIEDIETGLKALVTEIKKRKIRSVAVPPLGCGLGGLDWRIVRPMIENAFRSLPDIHVMLFEPVATPDAKTMPVRTHRPKLTVARALLIELMQRYRQLAYRLTLLEIHKLAYFLQEAGEPLRLRYEAGIYGPYAPNLNKVLEVLEGHYTRGYGDTQAPDVEIVLLDKAIDEANRFLSQYKDKLHRLECVERLIEGFETPYGMELLSSVHWVSQHGHERAENVEEAIDAVRNWNERKRNMFSSDHIRIAWNRMVEEKWFPPAKK